MKQKELLTIRDLHVSAGDKEILHGVNLTVGSDETHVLMGPNGTGKSTLGYAITGNPAYTVTGGEILFDGENITDLPVNERANKGIFLSFQNPLEVPGVTLSAFIRSALEQKTGQRLRLWDFKKKLRETMALLSMDESYAERDLNVGFSEARHPRRDGLRSRCRRGAYRVAGRSALPRARPRVAAHHHAQHPHSRGAARRRDACHGGRRHREKRRRVAGGGDQRKRLRRRPG